MAPKQQALQFALQLWACVCGVYHPFGWYDKKSKGSWCVLVIHASLQSQGSSWCLSSRINQTLVALTVSRIYKLDKGYSLGLYTIGLNLARQEKSPFPQMAQTKIPELGLVTDWPNVGPMFILEPVIVARPWHTLAGLYHFGCISGMS